MTKVFTVNKNGKIELTKEELQKLLDDSYWEGYRANTGTYVYTSPVHWWNPWSVTYCNSSDTVASSTIDANYASISSDKISISLNDINDAIKAGDLKVEI